MEPWITQGVFYKFIRISIHPSLCKLTLISLRPTTDLIQGCFVRASNSISPQTQLISRQSRNDPDQHVSIRNTGDRPMAPNSNASVFLGLRFSKRDYKFGHLSHSLVNTVSRTCPSQLSTTDPYQNLPHTHHDSHLDLSCLPTAPHRTICSQSH
jgi:hypothetical protein